MRLLNCAADINSWCQTRLLQLNTNKTEIIWFGSQSNLAKLRNTDCSVQVGSSQIQPSTVVRDLGIHLDSELSMTQHIAKVAMAATCYPRDAMLARVFATATCPSVRRPSGRPSVTRRYCA